MRHLGRVWTPVFYAGFGVELLGVIWALAATAQPLPLRLAPLLLGYVLMVVAYWRARRAIRRWANPDDPAVWGRIGLRLLTTADLDAAFGDPNVDGPADGRRRGAETGGVEARREPGAGGR